ncbi:MAG: hypothetical protein AAF320_05025 [Myxococcota bacterium]
MNKYTIIYGLLASSLMISGCGDNESDGTVETGELASTASKCSDYFDRIEEQYLSSICTNYVETCKKMIGTTFFNPAKCIKNAMCVSAQFNAVCPSAIGGQQKKPSKAFFDACLQTGC